MGIFFIVRTHSLKLGFPKRCVALIADVKWASEKFNNAKRILSEEAIDQ